MGDAWTDEEALVPKRPDEAKVDAPQRRRWPVVFLLSAALCGVAARVRVERSGLSLTEFATSLSRRGGQGSSNKHDDDLVYCDYDDYLSEPPIDCIPNPGTIDDCEWCKLNCLSDDAKDDDTPALPTCKWCGAHCDTPYTYSPTTGPSFPPTSLPSSGPTETPSYEPTSLPYPVPTAYPTEYPSGGPSELPSPRPTPKPTHRPTEGPSRVPTGGPSYVPTTVPRRCPNHQTPSPDACVAGAERGSGA